MPSDAVIRWVMAAWTFVVLKWSTGVLFILGLQLVVECADLSKLFQNVGRNPKKEMKKLFASNSHGQSLDPFSVTASAEANRYLVHFLPPPRSTLSSHTMTAWTPQPAGLQEILQTIHESTDTQNAQVQRAITTVWATSFLDFSSASIDRH
jgi:hypothetical protein